MRRRAVLYYKRLYTWLTYKREQGRRNKVWRGISKIRRNQNRHPWPWFPKAKCCVWFQYSATVENRHALTRQRLENLRSHSKAEDTWKLRLMLPTQLITFEKRSIPFWGFQEFAIIFRCPWFICAFLCICHLEDFETICKGETKNENVRWNVLIKWFAKFETSISEKSRKLFDES